MSSEIYSNYDKQVYTVYDIMAILDIGKNSAYELVKEGQFPVIKIKSILRIPKKPFDEWLNKYNKVA